MNRTFITQLLTFLPQDSVYFNLNGVAGDRPGQLAIALNDTKFGWNFLRAIKEDGLEPPLLIENLPLMEADAYLRGGYNEAMDEAVALARPQYTTMRNLLKKLLISGDVTLENIGKWMRLPLEVVRLFDQVFFNVRDRRDEPGYIAQLLNPDGVRVNPDTNDEELLLLRAGAKYGAREVICLAGIKADGTGQLIDELHRDFEREILIRARSLVRHGSKEDLASPGMALAKGLAIAEKRIERDQPQRNPIADALGEQYKYNPVMETLNRMTQPAVDRMIELSRQEPVKKTEPSTLSKEG
jgi:hypothetical protein